LFILSQIKLVEGLLLIYPKLKEFQTQDITADCNLRWKRKSRNRISNPRNLAGANLTDQNSFVVLGDDYIAGITEEMG
jgi:hypothetical protein